MENVTAVIYGSGSSEGKLDKETKTRIRSFVSHLFKIQEDNEKNSNSESFGINTVIFSSDVLFSNRIDSQHKMIPPEMERYLRKVLLSYNNKAPEIEVYCYNRRSWISPMPDNINSITRIICVAGAPRDLLVYSTQNQISLMGPIWKKLWPEYHVYFAPDESSESKLPRFSIISWIKSLFIANAASGIPE